MMQYNKTYSGKVYKKTSNMAAVYANPEGYYREEYIVPDGTEYMLTGYYIYINGAYYYQCDHNFSRWINLKEGWTQVGYNTINYSQAQAQELVNGIIENNKYILENNLLCARYSHLLSKQDQQKLYDLQVRLEARNEALQNNQLCSNQQNSYPSGYANLGNYLSNFMSVGVGVVISTGAIIVVSAIVIALASTAAYLAYKAFYNESKQDVKYSAELTKTLQNKLTEQEYQQLLQETQGIVTRAKITQKINAVAGGASNILIFALGAYCFLRLPVWIENIRTANFSKSKKQKLLN